MSRQTNKQDIQLRLNKCQRKGVLKLYSLSKNNRSVYSNVVIYVTYLIMLPYSVFIHKQLPIFSNDVIR